METTATTKSPRLARLVTDYHSSTSQLVTYENIGVALLPLVEAAKAAGTYNFSPLATEVDRINGLIDEMTADSDAILEQIIMAGGEPEDLDW